MSAKKSYNRFFIIFQEEDRGYGTSSDRPPTGYVKVESKNDKSKVTAYVQNLKPYETGECLYKCYLISHQDNNDAVVYLGIMNIDDSGRGESSWESSVENAFGSKISIDKFNTAVITADREGSDNVVAPLAGYMLKEKFDWRGIISKDKLKVPIIKKPEKPEEKPEEHAIIFEEYEKQVEEVIEKKCEEKEEKKCEEKEEKKCEEKEEKKCEEKEEEEKKCSHDKREDESLPGNSGYEGLNIPYGESRASEESIQDLPAGESGMGGYGTQFAQYYGENRGEYDDDFTDRHKHKKEYKHGCAPCEEEKGKHMHKSWGHDGHYHNYRVMLRKMLEDILEDYEEADIQINIKGCRMWKIDLKKYDMDKHKVYMYPCYDLLYYPIICSPYYSYYNYIQRHGHYLFGINYEDNELKKLIFAIPGRNNIYDQPFQGSTGFTKWIKPFDREGLGYWIMAYDPMTGYVTEPED